MLTHCDLSRRFSHGTDYQVGQWHPWARRSGVQCWLGSGRGEAMCRRRFGWARELGRASPQMSFWHRPSQAKKRSREYWLAKSNTASEQSPNGSHTPATWSIGIVLSGAGGAHQAVQMLQASGSLIWQVHRFTCDNTEAACQVLLADFQDLHACGDLVPDPPGRTLTF